MTVTSEVSRTDPPYIGNGATTVFPYGFRIFEAGDLVVTEVDLLGNETTLVLGVDYTVSGVLADDGGNVTLTTALAGDGTDANSHKLIIRRVLSATQTMNLRSQGKISAEVLERAHDRAVMLIQQLQDEIARSLRLPEGEAGSELLTVLPSLAERKGKALGFDGGTGKPVVGSAGTITSVAMEPVVSASSLASARAQMGASGVAISVKDAPYLAIGDNSADDTSAISAAVAAAYAGGHHVYWPAGTYLTTDSIPHFHDVVHYGPGKIRRAGVDYAITPTSESTANILHVSTTGSDTNDGIGAAQALATIQKAVDIINVRSLSLAGRWEISVAAGTYTQSVLTSSMAYMAYPIVIRGPAVSGGSPTATLKSPVASTAVVEISGGGGVWFTLRDLNLQDATADYAVRIGAKATVGLENIRGSACLNGILSQHGAFVAVDQYCDFNGTGTGAGGIGFNEYYNATHSIVGASAGNAARFRNFTTGIWLNEGVQGHLDYTRVEDCTTGMICMRGVGGVNPKQMRIYRCGVGLELWGNCWFNNAIDFGTGADACTINVKAYGGSPEVDYLAQDNNGKTMRCVRSVEALVHTGTVAETVLHQEEIRPWMVSEGQHTSRWTIFGQSSLANACTVRCYANDGTTDDYFTGVTIPIGTTEWRIDIEIAVTAKDRQRCMMTAMFSGGGQSVVYGSSVLDLKNKSGHFRWSAQLGAVGDSITVHASRYETTLGG